MKTAGISLLLVLGLAACAPSKSLQPDSPGPQISGSGTCNADKVSWVIGQEAVEGVLGRVWKESGAGLLRPLAPGQAATRDYRPDRINVHIDAHNVVTKVDCG